ncbi:hypothetical protein ND486_07585 [Pseudonocardia sp. DR1-2]|uniref:hypothetical protein n=1 Tax=Pseudonocardia sp. DR1-2 TaxID=2951168 RepID=UPI002043A5A8|nr:hypothetical protein [Pseudonocardia sp. DR1-2]MCM3846053.1 hypothetical protein [Pseudonocardia sp. DR1-2]
MPPAASGPEAGAIEPSGAGVAGPLRRRRRLDQRATSEADQRIADRLSALVEGREIDNDGQGDDEGGAAGALVPVG